MNKSGKASLKLGRAVVAQASPTEFKMRDHFISLELLPVSRFQKFGWNVPVSKRVCFYKVRRLKLLKSEDDRYSLTLNQQNRSARKSSEKISEGEPKQKILW